MQKLLTAGLIGALCLVILGGAIAQDETPSLSEALATLEVPPAWFADISSDYGTDHPWKDARLKIRELLGEQGDKARGARDCQICFEECEAVGYHAIEMREVELPLGDTPEGIFSDVELEQMSRIHAPFVNVEACTGCGLCEYRCHATYVKQETILEESAIRVVAEQKVRIADSG